MPDLADWRERLRGAIRKTGRRQNAIAEQAGVDPVTLSRVLTGGHVNPRFDTVVAIVHATGETVGWLLQEQGFNLSGDQREKVRTAAVVLMDVTGGKQSDGREGLSILRRSR